MKLTLDDILPHVAHDVRALARKGLSNAQLLEKLIGPAAAPEISSHLRSIIESQLDLNRLFARLVMLVDAQTPAGQPEEWITLEVALLSTKMKCRDALRQASAELAVSEPIPVCVIPRKIESVLQELVENSIQFRDPARPLCIGIDTHVKQDKVFVLISDNGVGIDSAYVSSLFKPFKRLDARRSGFGLGLSIASGIVEAAGGRLYHEQNDPGAAFVVELAIGG